MAEEATEPIREFVGEVTISSVEYRALIETATALKCELNNIKELHDGRIEKLTAERNRYFDDAMKHGETADALEKEIRILNHYKDFVTTNEARHKAFKAWEENNG